MVQATAVSETPPRQRLPRQPTATWCSIAAAECAAEGDCMPKRERSVDGCDGGGLYMITTSYNGPSTRSVNCTGDCHTRPRTM